MKTVVFACVHNAGRSQMAAAFFNALADPARVAGVSAGTQPAEHVHPGVVDAMREAGFDLSSARPRRLTPELLKDACLLVTMGCGESCPVVPGLPREDWPLTDPKGLAPEGVRSVRDEIRSRIADLIQREGWEPPSERSEARPATSGLAGGRKANVLFLCTGNSARSQMAEVLLRHRAGDRFDVHSAGLEPSRVHPLTLEVLREQGLPTAGLRSKPISEFLGKVSIRYAIIVCEKAAGSCPHIYPLALRTLYWPFEDPAACVGPRDEALDTFREVRDAIDERIQAWLAELPDR